MIQLFEIKKKVKQMKNTDKELLEKYTEISKKNKEEIIKNAQQTYFNDKYSKYLKDIDVDFNDDQAKKIKLSTDENVKAVNLMTVYNTISKELNKK